MAKKMIMRKVLSFFLVFVILMSAVPVSVFAVNGGNNATDNVSDSLSEVDTPEDIVVSGVDDVTYEAGCKFCNFSGSNIKGNTSNTSEGAITHEEVVASGFAGVLSAQDATISNPAISSGTTISKADMVAVSANLEGGITVSQWNWLMAEGVYEINITYVVELWESTWWFDKMLATKSFVHKAEFPMYKDYARVYTEEKDKWVSVTDLNEYNELMRNLDDAPIILLDSDKDIYAKVKARMEIMGYFIFDPFGLGHQQETEWSKSNTISVHVYENPSPLITFLNVYPKTIKLGEKIVIWIDCKNNGSKAGPSSTISVSFPSLTDPNDDKQVTIIDHDFYSSDNCYLGNVTKDDQIWVWQGNNKVPVMEESKAEYLLVEGGTSKEGGWDSGITHTLGMEVCPKKPGTFDIYYRVALTTLTDANDLRKIFYIPSSGLKDQQNFYVFHESVTVTDPITSLDVKPDSRTMDVNDRKPFTATATYKSGKTGDVTNYASWSTSDSSILSHLGNGQMEALKEGSATVTVSYEGKSDSSSVTVNDPITSLDVKPDSRTMDVNDRKPFTATATYKSGKTGDVTNYASWSTSDSSILNHLGNGQMEALKEGSATVTVSYEGKSDSSSVIISAKVGSISTTSNPSGANVYLDGTYKGTSPITIPNVPVGSHTVKYTKSSYEDCEKTVTVNADQQTNVHCDLVVIAQKGSIYATSNPSGANVYLDGTYKGTSPIAILNVPVGSHTIKYTKSGYTDCEKTVTVNADQQTNVHCDLVASDTAPPETKCTLAPASPDGENEWYITPVTVTLESTDPSGIEWIKYRIDSGSWQTYDGSKVSFTVSNDGLHCITYYARDKVGNEEEQKVSDLFKIDQTNPSASISINNGAESTNSGSVTLYLSYSDATSGVRDCGYKNEGDWWSSWESCSSTKSWTLAPGEGTKRVYYQVRDNAGNIKEVQDTIVLQEDKLEPKLCTSLDPPSTNFGTVPQNQTRTWEFFIINFGSGTLIWTISSDQPSWINVNPTSGSTTTEADVVTVTIDTHGLSPGTYTGHITIESNGGSRTGTITVNVSTPSTPNVAFKGIVGVPCGYRYFSDRYFSGHCIEVTKILSDPNGKMVKCKYVCTCWAEDTLAQIDNVACGDEVEVYGSLIEDPDILEEWRIVRLETSTHYMTRLTQGPPKLCTSPDPPSRDFGTVPKDQTRSWNFEITNCGSGTLTWSVNADKNWISVNPTSESTTTETDTVTVTISTYELTPGTYTGHVTITSNDGSKTGTIIVEVPPPVPEPKLCTSPDPPSSNFGTVPQNQTRTWEFFITNCGSDTLTWTISCDQPWIRVNPTSDSTTKEADVVTVTIDTHGLSPGTYTGHVTLTSNGGSKTGTITVNVQKEPEKLPDLQIHSMLIEPNPCKSTDHVGANFDLKNAGDADVSAFDATLLFEGEVLEVFEISEVVKPAESFPVSIWIKTPKEGKYMVCLDYSNRIKESNEDNNCASAYLDVTAPEPKLCTSPDPPSHDFGSVPTNQTKSWNFEITNCGSDTLTWTISSDQPWINVNPTSGSTTTGADVVTLTINTYGLTPGTYTGNVTITSNDGSKTGTITVKVPPSPNQPPENPTLIPDKSSPQLAGTTIKWTASATDPDGDPLYYQFRLKGPATGNSWRITRDWNTANTWTWHSSPADIGDTDISVWIRDGHHESPDKFFDIEKIVYDYKITADKKRPTATIDSITPNPATQGKDTVHFKGHGSDTDGYIVDYYWNSSKDGFLSSSNEFTKSASNLDVGTHTIYFKVKDNDGQWSDWATATLRIEKSAEKPDLIVTSILFNPNPASAGDDVVVSVTVKNQGSGDAGAHDEFLGYPDRYTLLKEWYCPGLKAGDSETFTHTLTNVQKSDTYKACADWGQVVEESDEDINCRIAYLEVKEVPKYVKFRGVVTGTSPEGLMGAIYWYVNVDEWLSGSLSCDEIDVAIGMYPPFGSWDENICKGDRVEAYGEVNPWGGGKCTVGLNGESYYIKKTEPTPQQNCKVKITSHSSLQDRPSIVYANGYYYVAYQSHEKGYGIFLEKFDSNWNFNKKVEVVSGSAYYDSPSLLFANNKLYVAYVSNAKGANKNDYDVIVKEYDPNSLSCTKGAKYLTSLQSCQDLPALYYKDGYFYMAYQSWETGNGDIYIKKFDSSWNQLKKVQVASGSSLQDRPSITYADRYFYVAYFSKETGNYDIFVQNFNNDLMPLWGRRQITSESSSQSYPFITFVNNQFAISYASTESGTLGIYMKKYSSTWNFIEKTKVVDSSANERRPSHTWDGSNFWVAYVYNYGDSKDWNIFAITPDCEGGSVPTPTPLP